MKEIGVLVVAYGSRAASMVEALTQSKKEINLYVADKQKNPYLMKKAKETNGVHKKTGLSVNNLVEFAKNHKEEIDFGLIGPENPIIEGVRDKIEEATDIEIISPTSDYALEGSKVRQRKLINKVYPKANPEYKVFSKQEYSSKKEAVTELNNWLDKIGDKVAVKPNKTAAGKGVGVWGDHFTTRKELINNWFLPNYKDGKVLVEKKVPGEEFSVQFISDGKNLIPTPPIRDYKRAHDGGLGPNTGGMGTYSYGKTKLPFMEEKDWEEGIKIAKEVFKELKKEGASDELRGVPLYMGYVVTKEGIKLFEINSRFGDPECQNLMALLKNDFVEVCQKIINQELKKLEFEDKKTALTYAVPPTYGDARKKYTGNKEIKLNDLYKLKNEKYQNKLHIHEGNLIKKGNKTYSSTSRSICTLGKSKNLQKAREISLEGIKTIDGALWNRWDIASKKHIKESKNNINELRQ